jgi:hypothetical protein
MKPQKTETKVVKQNQKQKTQKQPGMKTQSSVRAGNVGWQPL